MKINSVKGNSRILRCAVITLFLCLAFFFFSISAHAETDYQVTEMQMQGEITTDSALNVRSGPGKEYDVIAKAKNDTLLTITGQADNGWYQVEIDGKTGYVSDQYVTAVENAAEEPEKEAGEPEEGYRGLNQSPYVIKLAVIGAVIVVIVIMLLITLKGLRRDSAEDDEDDAEEDDGDEEADDEDENDDEDDGDEDDEDEDEDEETARPARKGRTVKKAEKKEYILREEDYRVQIDPSFFEDKEPIEQPAMVTGYLERKKIEEAAAGSRTQAQAAGAAQADKAADSKQKELDEAMEKLNELQKEIERLKNQE